MSGFANRYGRWINAPASTNRPTGLKVPLAGIGPRQVSEVGSRVDDIGGVVANTYWSLLQPVEGGDIDTAATTPNSYKEIKDALALRYTSNHPDPTLRGQPVPVRVRVHTGQRSPDWATVLGASAGAPTQITLCDSEHDQPGDLIVVPWFWTPEYLAAWDNLMHLLSLLLDNEPAVREVACHPATTVYGGEPFQRGITKNSDGTPILATAGPNIGKSNVQVLYEAMHASDSRAGYADVQVSAGKVIGPALLDAAALQYPVGSVTKIVSGVSTTMSRWRSLGWETTRYYTPFNPLQQWRVKLDADGSPLVPFDYDQVVDPGDFTKTVMNLASSTMRSRVVEGTNNSLLTPLGASGAKYPSMYADLTGQTVANSFQTADWTKLRAPYQTSPGVYSQSDSVILARALDVGMGLLTSSGDPNGLVTPPVTALRGRFIELPDGWGVPGILSAAAARAYNIQGLGLPTGD